jgi:hypothetical protein
LSQPTYRIRRFDEKLTPNTINIIYQQGSSVFIRQALLIIFPLFITGQQQQNEVPYHKSSPDSGGQKLPPPPKKKNKFELDALSGGLEVSPRAWKPTDMLTRNTIMMSYLDRKNCTLFE